MEVAQSCISLYLYLYLYTYTHTHIYIYILDLTVYVCIHTHAHTHTHILGLTSWVAQSCLILCDHMDYIMPGFFQLSSVQVLSRVWLFVTPWITARQASLFITNSQSLLTHVHWVGDAIQPSHPLLSLLLLPSIFPSIRVFYSEAVLHIGGQSFIVSAS